MDKLKELLFLKSIAGIGNVRINKFYLPLLQNNDIDRIRAEVLTNESKSAASNAEAAYEYATTLSEALSNNTDFTVCTVMDQEYPKRLHALGNQRPVVIFVKGNISLLGDDSISVVGTRNPSPQAAEIEKVYVNRIINQSERVIISGLATGCDTVAHKTCIDVGGKTIAVLPCGFNCIFPEENRGLCEEITASGGVLISEYPPDTPASHYTFIERDRIIAALGDAMLVMQCAKRSGTMHSVDDALKMRKIIGVYNPSMRVFGDYSGNRYIIDRKGGFAISSHEELEKFLIFLRESGRADEPVQMTIF